MADELAVSLRAVYEKLARGKPGVSERLVKTMAKWRGEIVDSMPGAVLAPAPLPGFSLALLDPQRTLLRSIVAELDAHAGERSCFDDLVERVCKGECVVAVRTFSTRGLLLNVQQMCSCFVSREHWGMPLLLVGAQHPVQAEEDATYDEQREKVVGDGTRSRCVASPLR